jgi:hypothetical protein
MSTEVPVKQNTEKRLSKDECIAIIDKEVKACNQMSDRLRKIYGPNVKDTFVKEKKVEIMIGVYHFINAHPYMIENNPMMQKFAKCVFDKSVELFHEITEANIDEKIKEDLIFELSVYQQFYKHHC